MKQGRLLTGVVTFLLAAGVILYMGLNIFMALTNPLRTAAAILYSREETLPVSGFVVRDETVLDGDVATSEILTAEGAKVARGETIARRYESGDAESAAKRLAEIEARLSQLETARARSRGVADASRTEKAISELLFSVSSNTERGEFSTLEAAAAELKTHIYARDFIFSDGDDAAEADAVIASLTAEKTSLEAAGAAATVTLRAPDSGFYSRAADGYESVLTPDRLAELTAADLAELPEEKAAAGGAGKLVSGFRWYFIGTAPTEYASAFEVGDVLRVRFSSELIGEVGVRVERVAHEEDGASVLVLSSSERMGELISARRQTIDIILSIYEGIRVPAEAIRVTEDGVTGVYCLVALQARFVEVERIYELGSYYIVRYDPSSSAALRPGDEIIVSSKDLYDGKIIQG